VARRAITARFEDGRARVRADAGDLADAAMVRRLQSGLPQTLVTRVYAYRGDATTPLAIGVRSCRVTYDPWGLTYRVQIQTDASDRSETMSSIDRVVDACLDLDGLAVGRARDWDGARGAAVWFAVLVELNPLSPDTVHRIRRWLARPDGVGTSGDAFFGSFVSLFVNRRIGDAERVLRFRSSDEVRCP
nr:hypothetical protein [Myxococcota bacterium]